MEKRPSPWYCAVPTDRVVVEVDSACSLVACVRRSTPDRIRLGVMIEGRETSIVVPLERARSFLQMVRDIVERGAIVPAGRPQSAAQPSSEPEKEI